MPDPTPPKCCSSDCDAEAVVTVHWPGQSKPMCKPCEERAQGAARAMGFALSSTDLEVQP